MVFICRERSSPSRFVKVFLAAGAFFQRLCTRGSCRVWLWEAGFGAGDQGDGGAVVIGGHGAAKCGWESQAVFSVRNLSDQRCATLAVDLDDGKHFASGYSNRRLSPELHEFIAAWRQGILDAGHKKYLENSEKTGSGRSRG